jgi:hypothetical protein
MTSEQRDPVLDALRAAVQRFDPVPDEVVVAAKAAYTWRTIDEELAALTFDSLVDDAVTGVRGSGPRALTFESDDVVIELEIVDSDHGRTLRGQVTGEVTDLELDTPGDPAPVPLAMDELGRFSVMVAPTGPIRLRGRRGDRVVTTSWVIA